MTEPPPPGWGYPPPPVADYPPPYGGYPPPVGGYPPQYGAYPAPQGTNGLAVASLVCSVTSPLLCFVLAIVGVVLGVVALNQIKRTGQNGRGLALAGIIVGAVIIAVAIAAIVLYLSWYSANVGGLH